MWLDYNDEYPTCTRTHAGLCIYTGDLSPDDVVARLKLASARIQIKGQRDLRRTTREVLFKTNAAFLDTAEVVQSKDLRRHIDWILERCAGKEAAIREEMQKGVQFVVSCFWGSAQGHGGPALTPTQMAKLGALGFEIWFDVYFEGEKEQSNSSEGIAPSGRKPST